MKKLFTGILVVLVVLMFFLNTWQGYRYEAMRRDVKKIEEEQKDWLDKNEKLIAGLALFSSPGRIENIAENQLKLKRIDPSRILKVVFTSSAESEGNE